MNYVHLIFQNIEVFHDSLIKRNTKATNTTWDDFKVLMCEEYQAIDYVKGLIIDNSNLDLLK